MKKKIELPSFYEAKIERMVKISTFLFLTILFISLCFNTFILSGDPSLVILLNSICLFLIIVVVVVCQRVLFVGKLHTQFAFVIFLFFILPHLHSLTANKFIDIKYIFFSYYVCFMLFLYFLARLLNSYLMHITKLKKEYEELVNHENCNRLSNLICRSVFHDLSTPLSVVYGISKMLQDGSIKGYEEKQALEKLLLATQQMENIIDSSDILIRRKNIEDNFSPLCEIRKLINLLLSRIKRNEINVVITGDKNILIFGEKVMFLRVCMNILINSIEEFERISKRKKKIVINVVKRENTVVITFRDNGDGFEKDTVLGCGLQFCKLVLKEKFYGYLKITSKRSKYCKVSLYIPAS